MKQLVTDQMHALSRDVKTRLLFLHDCCHKTEMLATDAEVETTRFSAHVHNVREHELSALEHQIHAIRSQAKISEEKMIAEMKRKEDENQAKSQMLMLKLLLLPMAVLGMIEPQRLIVDTDMGFDVDDAVALCLANSLHMNGHANLVVIF